MKKTFVLVFILASLITSILLINKNQEKKYDYKSIFMRWEKGEIEVLEGIKIMNSFKEYLIINPEFSNEDILKLSFLFKVYEKDKFRIIEYTENPEYYGSSAKGSYHIVTYDGRAEIIDIDGSIRINEIIKLNENLYYIYITDYKFSNITGINIFSITINEKNIEYKPIIAKDEIIYGFKFIDSLYYNNEHIYFEDIRNNGSEVEIKINDASYMLLLKEDGLYHLKEQIF